MPDITLKALVYMFSFNYCNNLWHGCHRPHFTSEEISLEKKVPQVILGKEVTGFSTKS